jgi:hypothetical protein
MTGGGTRLRPTSAAASTSAISQVFGSSASAGAAAVRDRLVPQNEVPSRFCVHCRGPHLKGGPPHPHYTIADRYKGLSIDVTEFAKQHKAGGLPAAKDNGLMQAIRWKVAGAPAVGVDVATWLPIFIDGARELTEPLRMIAVQGAKAMMRLPSSRVVPLVPALVAPLRTGLNTFEPSTVAAALDLLRFLLLTHRGACDALMACDGFRRMLPVQNLMRKSRVKTRVGYDLKVVGGKQVILGELIAEVLLLMEKQGGDKGTALIKSYIPTY